MELKINKLLYEVSEPGELGLCLRALEYFLKEEAMAPWLHWHEERPPANELTKS